LTVAEQRDLQQRHNELEVFELTRAVEDRKHSPSASFENGGRFSWAEQQDTPLEPSKIRGSQKAAKGEAVGIAEARNTVCSGCPICE
jgi:hypothetical protein